MALRDGAPVQLCVDFFLCAATLPRYLGAIRGFTLRDARCCHAADAQLVSARVLDVFYSDVHFERFVQMTAIAHAATAVAKRTGLSHAPDSARSELAPWAALAAELGFSQLADALQRARPAAWLANAEPSGVNIAPSAGAAGDRTWRAHLGTRVDSWFRRELRPLLEQSRQRSVRARYLAPPPAQAGADAQCDGTAMRAYAARVASGALAGAPPAVIASHRAASEQLDAAVDAGERAAAAAKAAAAPGGGPSLSAWLGSLLSWGLRAPPSGSGSGGGKGGAPPAGGGARISGARVTVYEPSVGHGRLPGHALGSIEGRSRVLRAQKEAERAGARAAGDRAGAGAAGARAARESGAKAAAGGQRQGQLVAAK